MICCSCWRSGKSSWSSNSVTKSVRVLCDHLSLHNLDSNVYHHHSLTAPCDASQVETSFMVLWGWMHSFFFVQSRAGEFSEPPWYWGVRLVLNNFNPWWYNLLALINTKPTCVLQMCLLIVPLFKNRSGYRTPVKGLYMCGAGSHPGGGVMGAPGRNAATIVLKDRLRAWHACSLVCKVCCPITEGVPFRRALGNKFQKWFWRVPNAVI